MTIIISLSSGCKKKKQETPEPTDILTPLIKIYNQQFEVFKKGYLSNSQPRADLEYTFKQTLDYEIQSINANEISRWEREESQGNYSEPSLLDRDGVFAGVKGNYLSSLKSYQAKVKANPQLRDQAIFEFNMAVNKYWDISIVDPEIQKWISTL